MLKEFVKLEAGRWPDARRSRQITAIVSSGISIGRSTEGLSALDLSESDHSTSTESTEQAEYGGPGNGGGLAAGGLAVSWKGRWWAVAAIGSLP